MKTFITFLLAVFLCIGIMQAQERSVSGKVTNEKGEPLIGVTVMVKGSAVGTYTKSGGVYKLTVPRGAKSLIFRVIGMKTKEIEIGTKDEINVVMEEDVVRTEEIVVTAIGLEREKKSIGYAIEDIKGSKISESKTTNVLNALTGKVAGVQITNSSGASGSSAFIKIRGISSITGSNQPLFIVDGIPIDNSMSYSGNPDDGANNLLYGVAYSNRAIDINPDDIESITVLKGPAATALYGIRAASGAIVITTKKGVIGVGDKINVNFTSTMAFEEVNKMPELQMTYAQGQWVDAAGKRYGQSGFDITTAKPTYRGPATGEALSWGPKISELAWDGTSNNRFDKNGNVVSATDPTAKIPMRPYNNVDDFYRTGAAYTQSLSMAGGGDFASFFLSLSNQKKSGVIPRDQFERSTVKISGESNVSRNFKASGSISYTKSGGTRIQQGSNTSGVMLGLLRTPPSFDNSNGFGEDAADKPEAYMFANGTQRTYRGGGGYDNPFWTVNRNPFNDEVNRFIGYFQLNYYITDWFDVMYRVGLDNYIDKRKQIFALYSRTVPTGRTFEHNLTSNQFNSDLVLTFTQKLSEDIGAKLLVGNNLFEDYSTSMYIQADNIIIPDFYHISNFSGAFQRESKDKLRRLALYGDLTVDYLEWLYLNGTVRWEKSTTLPKDNNAFVYGSANLSFVFTDAFKDVFKDSFMNFGKLRMNYAVVGKDAPMYSTTTPFTASTLADGWVDGISFPFLNVVGYSKDLVLGTQELKPEKTTSLEFGLNLAFLDGLFDLDLTYYNSKSVDQIFAVRIARTTGYAFRIVNAGEISNKGFEGILNIHPFRGDEFNWTFSLNFSTNSNMVDKLAPGIENLFLGGFEGSSIRAVAGKPYGTIFGFGFLKDPATGKTIIDDDPNSENYGYPILDQNEKDFGSANPDWLMGINNTFSYGGFTLSFLFDIKQGGVLWNGTKGALYYFGTHKDTEIRGTKKVFDGVKGHFDEDGKLVTNGTNDIQANIDQAWLAFGNGNGFIGSNTEDFVEDASWVRLRELSLSYQLPKSIVEYTPFSEIGLTFTGRNLWLSTPYTGIDPETSLTGASNAQGLDYFNMPGVRSYNFSLNVKF